MKVHELIKELQGIENQNAEVITEGCDCNGEASRLFVDNDGDVIICREISCYFPRPVDTIIECQKPSKLSDVVKGKL
jgi:hypothetical protein